MKLLGHTDPEMTMRYVDVALTDFTARVPIGACKTTTPHSSTENAPSFCSHWSHRRTRLDHCRSACARDVPSHPARQPRSQTPRPALQSLDQNPCRSAQTRYSMRSSRDCPVKPTIRPQMGLLNATPRKLAQFPSTVAALLMMRSVVDSHVDVRRLN